MEMQYRCFVREERTMKNAIVLGGNSAEALSPQRGENKSQEDGLPLDSGEEIGVVRILTATCQA